MCWLGQQPTCGLKGNFQHTKGRYIPKHLSEMVQHLYSDDDKSKKSEITAVPTAFSFEGTIN